MKLLFVANGFPPSGQWGTEYYTHQLATGLARRGAEVVVLVPSREAGRERYSLRRDTRDGVQVVELANAGDPGKAFTDSYSNPRVEELFAELCAAEHPEVVHFTHMLWGLSVGLARVAHEHGARTVATLTDFGLLCHRGQLFDWRLEDCEGPTDRERCARCVREPGRWDARPLAREARRLAVRTAAAMGGLGRVVVESDIAARDACIASAVGYVDHWIFPTRALARPFLARGWREREHTVLGYGIDEDRYRGPRVEAQRTRFVYMSQYMPHKGLACLLEATRRLEEQEGSRAWSVDLFGNGGRDRARLYAQALVRDGLPARVRDRGSFEPLRAPEVLARTDCVVVPSEWRENAPLTVLQARAAGVPVLASDVEGVREVLEDGRHGRLFPRGDAGALCEAMAAVLRGELAHVAPDPLVTLDEHLRAVQAIYGERTRVWTPPVAPVPALAERA